MTYPCSFQLFATNGGTHGPSIIDHRRSRHRSLPGMRCRPQHRLSHPDRQLHHEPPDRLVEGGGNHPGGHLFGVRCDDPRVEQALIRIECRGSHCVVGRVGIQKILSRLFDFYELMNTFLILSNPPSNSTKTSYESFLVITETTFFYHIRRRNYQTIEMFLDSISIGKHLVFRPFLVFLFKVRCRLLIAKYLV